MLDCTVWPIWELPFFVSVANVYSGSAVIFYAPRFKHDKMVSLGIHWTILLTILGGLALFFFSDSSYFNLILLVLLGGCFTSLKSLFMNMVLGQQKILAFNKFLILYPLLILAFLGICLLVADALMVEISPV